MVETLENNYNFLEQREKKETKYLRYIREYMSCACLDNSSFLHINFESVEYVTS